MLAEAVPLGGDAVLVILLVALLVLTLSATLVVLGFVLAPRAGRGSRRALTWWIVILALEGLWCAGSVAAVSSGDFTFVVIVPPVVVGAQMALFANARRDSR